MTDPFSKNGGDWRNAMMRKSAKPRDIHVMPMFQFLHQVRGCPRPTLNLGFKGVGLHEVGDVGGLTGCGRGLCSGGTRTWGP
eukprot:74051-Pyramimonas_sp.AAC.1